MDLTIPIALNAITLISILMLVGLGLAIIFGLMNVINMAHGEFVTICAFDAPSAPYDPVQTPAEPPPVATSRPLPRP